MMNSDAKKSARHQSRRRVSVQTGVVMQTNYVATKKYKRYPGALRCSKVKNHVNQEMLATMVGTTRSRINQFMNKFRKLGYIKYNGKIEVNNSWLNLILHDDPQNQKT